MAAITKDSPPLYGRPEQLTPLIRRVLADNPGPFTYTGTGTFIVGCGEVAVIDPGPELDAHFDALTAALQGERVSHILITHTHSDHWPLSARLSQATGAPVLGLAPKGRELAEYGFSPPPADGEAVAGPGWTLRALHTPGHASNHICYALEEERALFSGDHVMGWSTTVIAPPDGDMDDYLSSLDKVAAGGFEVLWPTHGPPIERPAKFLRAYRAHRLQREERIAAHLKVGPSRVAEMVAALYAEIDPRLHPAAARTVAAHLLRLQKLGRAACDGEPPLEALWRLS
jgi:glyoxylase-like metal-dependent hydrolase (beta-lactamase superfamily II)